MGYLHEYSWSVESSHQTNFTLHKSTNVLRLFNLVNGSRTETKRYLIMEFLQSILSWSLQKT